MASKPTKEPTMDYFSAESVAQFVREQREKCTTLHKSRIKAYDKMRQTTDQHRFLVDACREAEETERELVHRLNELCRRQAMEMVAGV